MKRTLVILIGLVILMCGCSAGPSTSPVTATLAATEAPTPTTAVEPEGEMLPDGEVESTTVEELLAEMARLEELMAPKKAEIEEKIDATIPASYKHDSWYYASADIWSEGLFAIDVQVNVPDADIESAKDKAVEIHQLLVPLELEIEFDAEEYWITVVDDGKAIIFLTTTENENEYMMILEDGSSSIFTIE